jgi:Uncharacterized protein conserved in bacteria
MGRILSSAQMRNALVALGLLLAAGALVVYPTEALAGAREGLELCANVIVPSLFPFFVVSTLILDLGFAGAVGRVLAPLMRPLFRLSGVCASALVLGLVGGYPVGARTAMELYRNGQCSRTEAERMLAFCNNSGPAFIFGAVGAGVFGYSGVALLLYGVHVLASVLVGLLFRFYPARSDGNRTAKAAAAAPKALSVAFTGAVTGAMGSALNISAFVVLFSIVVRLLTCSGALPALVGLLTAALAPLEVQSAWIAAWLTGLLELSGGVWALSQLRSLSASVTLAAFMLGWAGLSVHCQTLSFLGGLGLSCRSYFLGKLLHGVISAVLLQLFLFWRPLPVAGYLAAQTETLTLLEGISALTAAATASFVLFGFFLLFAACVQGKQGKNCLKKR